MSVCPSVSACQDEAELRKLNATARTYVLAKQVLPINQIKQIGKTI